MSLFSPFSSKSSTTRSTVHTANLVWLGAQASATTRAAPSCERKLVGNGGFLIKAHHHKTFPPASFLLEFKDVLYKSIKFTALSFTCGFKSGFKCFSCILLTRLRLTSKFSKTVAMANKVGVAVPAAYRCHVIYSLKHVTTCTAGHCSIEKAVYTGLDRILAAT